jgi:hypothetical protein
MVSELGPGFAITDAHGDPLPGRWPTYEEAREQGYLGVYMLSGVDIVELVDVDGRLVTRKAD